MYHSFINRLNNYYEYVSFYLHELFTYMKNLPSMLQIYFYEASVVQITQ